MTKDLYTTDDVKKVRDSLLNEQENIDPLTKEPIQRATLDHRHDFECLVRGVLSRESNSFEGKVSGAYARYFPWWSDVSLPDVLRNLADYYEKGVDDRYRHPAWRNEVTKAFRKLNAAEKCKVLDKLGAEKCKNDKERLNSFKKYLTKTSGLGYDYLMSLIKEVSNV